MGDHIKVKMRVESSKKCKLTLPTIKHKRVVLFWSFTLKWRAVDIIIYNADLLLLFAKNGPKNVFPNFPFAWMGRLMLRCGAKFKTILDFSNILAVVFPYFDWSPLFCFRVILYQVKLVKFIIHSVPKGWIFDVT